MKRDIMAWAAVATSAAEPEKLQVEYGRRKIVLTINDRAARVWRELRASILLPRGGASTGKYHHDESPAREAA